jgi:hypothetical protein
MQRWREFRMPANHRGYAARLAVLLVLLVAGCGGQADESTAAGPSATSTTVAPTTTTVPPLMAEELAWLKAVTTLHKRMDKALQENVTLTREKMTSYATTLRACSRELTRIGSPSDRVQPVHAVVKKACRTYDKGAKCWATAASVSMADGGVVAGTPEEKIQSRAIECGGAAIGNGSNLLADAEAKGEELKAKYE